jgi:cytochrome c oxidase subunit IV
VWRVLTLVVWLLLLLLVICVVLVRVLENEGMLDYTCVLIHFILLTASSK